MQMCIIFILATMQSELSRHCPVANSVRSMFGEGNGGLCISRVFSPVIMWFTWSVTADNIWQVLNMNFIQKKLFFLHFSFSPTRWGYILSWFPELGIGPTITFGLGLTLNLNQLVFNALILAVYRIYEKESLCIQKIQIITFSLFIEQMKSQKFNIL